MSHLHLRVDIGEEHYAVPVDHVQEVTRIGDLTPVPGAESPILGATNLRGEVLPIVDLAAMLGVGVEADPDQIVVTEFGALRAGMAVGKVVGVSEMAAPDIPTDAPMLHGAVLVDGALIGVLDIAGALEALAAKGRT